MMGNSVTPIPPRALRWAGCARAAPAELKLQAKSTIKFEELVYAAVWEEEPIPSEFLLDLTPLTEGRGTDGSLTDPYKPQRRSRNKGDTSLLLT